MNYGACPRCGSRAPIVYRGVAAFCTSCGAERMPLTAKSTNLAGKPSIIGGAVTRAFGWVVLGTGAAVGLALLGILQAIFPAGFAGYAVGGPIIVLAAVLGTLLLRGGRSLVTSGEEEQRATRTNAVFSLGERRGGVVTAAEVAMVLSMSVPDADALMTALAKERPENVTLEVDDQGSIFYRVSARGLSRVDGSAWRVAPGVEAEPLEAEQPSRRRSTQKA